jgi:hypothetical protein
VTQVVLTEERRGELRELLEDHQRLDTEYPKVADYLDTAPRLPGTGDPDSDAAFDLRFVHYATCDDATSTNPYWDIVGPSVSARDGRRVVDGNNPKGSVRLAYAAMALQAMYAYAIPSPETLAWVAAFCEGRRLVELGAGRGYWIHQLERVGVDVAAYDVEPPDAATNDSFDPIGVQRAVWSSVRTMDQFVARADDALFLCWPPGWGDPMSSDVLAEFEGAGGNRLIYIGEPKGGRTGNDAFFDGLSHRWELASEDSQYVSWWNLNDVAQGWIRR